MTLHGASLALSALGEKTLVLRAKMPENENRNANILPQAKRNATEFLDDLRELAEKWHSLDTTE